MAPLPPKFNSIEDVWQSKPGLKAGKLVNIIGIIKDFQPPRETGGSDSKCTIELTEPSNEAIKLNFFAQLDCMPLFHQVSVGDIVVSRQFKIQEKGGISLLSNNASELHILPASKVSLGGPKLENHIHWHKFRRSRNGIAKVFNHPTPEEIKYAITCSENASDLPDQEEFQGKVLQATNIQDKFTLLKDVPLESTKPFYDVIGEVIRKHHDGNNCATIHFSDYTPNSRFYKRVQTDRDDQVWKGPLGKMSMQISMWDQNAEFVIHSTVREGSWILIRNVQIGCNPNQTDRRTHLEGKIRTDGRKISITPLDHTDRNMDPRLRQAIKRKLEYIHSQKKKSEGRNNERKREADEPPDDVPTGKEHSKARRNRERAAAAKLAEEKLNLNKNVYCKYANQATTSFQDMLKQMEVSSGPDSENPLAPFTNSKYKARVRVVDYFPDRLKDFAHEVSEFDLLSDYDEDEGIDGDVETWEWGFALQVEDCSTKQKNPERMWLMVNNSSAQYLLNDLKNAEDLRKNDQLLENLTEKLFLLWGDLKEKKSARLPPETPPPTKEASVPPSSMPNADAEDAEFSYVDDFQGTKTSVAERESTTQSAILDKCADNDEKPDLAPSNKPFECVIQQYGIEVPEEDDEKADARPGFRWQRMFGLVDTTIK